MKKKKGWPKIRGVCKAALAALFMALCCAVMGTQPVSAKDDQGNIVIVIDPGHGGSDPGTIGVNGVKEEDANFEIARAMMNELKKYQGVRVYLTRPEDEWNTNTGRAMVAAELDADFLISIHNNSGTESNSGAIVYTSVLPLYSTITADMGNYILSNLGLLGITNNGIQTRNSTEYVGEDYYTIMGEGMRAGVPTVLVEHCFLSNPEDSLHVSHEDGTLDYEKTASIGKADADAVVTYFQLQKNTAGADSKSSIDLEKGYSVQVVPSKEGTGNISWISSNSQAVTVDEKGLATAVGGGTANIMYSYEDGTNGYITVNVNIPQQVALVGSIDPTFYNSQEKFNNINLSNVFADVIYSDGSVSRVKPDNVASEDLDLSKVGIQDIPITYGALRGSVRVIFSGPGYTPEVTSKETEAETEPLTQPEPQSTSPTVVPTQQETAKEEEDTAGFDVMMIIRLAAGIVIVAVFAGIIYLLESRMGRKRRNKRRRRY